MKSSWGLVIICWGILIAIAAACLIPELRKTQEQKAADAEAARNRWKKRKEEDRRRKQEQLENAPAMGCLQNMFAYILLSLLALISIIVCIMVFTGSSS